MEHRNRFHGIYSMESIPASLFSLAESISWNWLIEIDSSAVYKFRLRWEVGWWRWEAFGRPPPPLSTAGYRNLKTTWTVFPLISDICYVNEPSSLMYWERIIQRKSAGRPHHFFVLSFSVSACIYKPCSLSANAASVCNCRQLLCISTVAWATSLKLGVNCGFSSIQVLFSIGKCHQLQRRQQKVVANVHDGRCSFFTPRVQLEWLLLILLAVEFGGKICEDAGVHTCREAARRMCKSVRKDWDRFWMNRGWNQ